MCKVFLSRNFNLRVIYSYYQSDRRKTMIQRKRLLQSVLLAAAVLMIGFGVWRGEADTVFSKAIRLCMECVGIG